MAGHRNRGRRWMSVNGLSFRILASGEPAPDRPPVVLVHGIGVSHRYLSRLHDVLAEDRDVYSIDLPGFGGLAKPAHDVDVPTMGHGLAAVIESLAVGPVALVGHSMGSQWVVEVGVQRPDLVDHLVTMGPVADERYRSVISQTVALAADTLGETPAINAIVFTDYLRCGPRWYLAQLRHMLAYPIEDRVRSLSMPLLLIRGSRDPIAGVEWCRRLRDDAPNAHLVQIPGAYHVAQHAAPRAVAGAIVAYVDGLGSGVGSGLGEASGS